MDFEGKDFVSIRDLNRSDIEEILDAASLMEPLAIGGSKMLERKVSANLFLEPSTRTRLSFESAMLRLGGNYISVTESQTSSIKKGESLSDTIRVVENYAVKYIHTLNRNIKQGDYKIWRGHIRNGRKI